MPLSSDSKKDSAIPLTDDQLIIESVLKGDVNRFEALVLKYRDKLFRFLIKNVRETDLAEDLTQEAFVEAFRSLGKFRRESSFSTWLIGIALNLSRNHFRKNRKKLEQVLLPENKADQNSYGDNPLDVLMKKKLLIGLEDEIHNLPEELRESLILISLEEYSYEETAKIVGIPIGTVKSRVFRAREMLREAMKKLERTSL
jgi:RNA polymerase sigma-70 factor, ECF subfamily